MQSPKELREQAVRARLAATLDGDDAETLIHMARESLLLADELDGGAKPNGQDIRELIDLSIAGSKPPIAR